MNRKNGEVVILILCAVLAVGAFAGAAYQSSRDGWTNRYPERLYPYQGPIKAGTNSVPIPKW